MKKLLIISAILLFCSNVIFAQSTIYFFYGKTGSLDEPLQIRFNGQDAFLLKKKHKKTCIMHSEGLLTVSFENSFNVGQYNLRASWADEIQLNLTPNSVHYIKLKMKKAGRDMAFEELDETEGKKELEKREYDDTFVYKEP